ncbi:hypothetical protein FT663_01416 [Candidozyma haemuli var. vulneris]|uniref:NADH dehydrogenase [ubiquinone] 1 alpha subcomplex subunit n=1 Tax=Candidozyma haemuli TaxID=45357 RepID=A0A2V1AY50_9ASCO|nr:hypothetical protein CXQ85_002742 [[Candida] haemuloni]KAF3992551.1 hypothetical protein FT662_01097 [[Candida] haemuloni var. vulneris]KAF3994503.1 hypothetical protein FT663_01416 [[Candida] haemuloni var. vulneris]PVH23017.1 hypothetical protein CXQ85_002742 [[Candida] haemuloni]
MDPIAGKYPYWKRILHKFQARRDIPFRKKFFVGYDLHGNTYWEFTIDGNMGRLRRKLEPFQQSLFKVDHFDTVPPQWHQWLRRTRNEPPSVKELLDDQLRQQRMKLLAQHADQKWENEKVRLENENRKKLQAELDRVEAENKKFEEEVKQATQSKPAPEEKTESDKKEADPWAEADAQAKSEDSPIDTATIKPRK